MATSGSTDYSVTRDNIIEDAMWLIGALGESESASTAAITKVSRSLNSMVKAWQADGLNLWTTTEATLYVQKGTNTYSLNATSGDNASNTSVETELNGAAAASATTLTVDSTAGMTAADVVLIELTDGSLDATTIVSVDSSTALTITTGLTSAASDNGNLYTFTTRAGRALDILSMRYKSADGLTETELSKISRDEYFNTPSKTTQSRPSSFYYDPQLGTGKIYLWPTPEGADGRLTYTYSRLIEDFDATGDNPDFPIEWAEALTYNLAMRIAPAYGKDEKALATIGPMAQQFKSEVRNWDNEKSSLFITPDDRI